MHETGQGLEEGLKNAPSKFDTGTYDLGTFRISLQSMLHRSRVEQDTVFPNAETLLILLHDVDAAFAQEVKVASSLGVMITG